MLTLGYYRWYQSPTLNKGELWDPTSVGEEDEIFLIRVCKSLISRRVLKSWGWWRYVMDQSKQYLLVLTLGCYRWYQTQTLNGGGLWDPISVGEEDETFLMRACKSLISKRVLKPWGWRWYVTNQSRQYLLVVGLGWKYGIRVRHRTNEDVESTKGVDCEIPPRLERGNKTFLPRV